jgi:hypothetical protein
MILRDLAGDNTPSERGQKIPAWFEYGIDRIWARVNPAKERVNYHL